MDMTENPAVSVIMTVYNGEQYLSQAIDSIRLQSLTDFEFVIVDDGSQDRTPEILKGAQADSRIRVISKQRLGRARALNVAWTCTRGAYIANIDADDLAGPSRLENQFMFLQQHPEIGLLGTAWRTIVGEDDGGRKNERIVNPPLTDSELRRALVRRNPFYHSSIMMPRHVLQEVNGYNEQLCVAIDYDLQVRIACLYQLANLPHVLATQRAHQSNFFRSIPVMKRYRTVVKIRWLAWHSFSRPVAELPYVFSPTSMLRHLLGPKLRQAVAFSRNLHSAKSYIRN
jgi:glycosyltransferase involved in cell wall biosynthesis